MGFESENAHRLHPVSILFSISASVKNLIIPGLLVLIFSKGETYEIWLMILFIPAVIWGLIHYLFLRYFLGTEEMVIKDGMIFRSTRSIPYSKIQNIDLVQNPFHRFFKVAEVRLETAASGSAPEAVLKVLSLNAVKKLRTMASNGETEVIETPEAETLLRLGLKDVVTFGLVSNRGMAVVLAALGIAWQLDESGDFLEPLTNIPFRTLGVVLLILGVIGLRILSVIWAIFKLHRFKLTCSQEDLHTQCGLFTRHSAAIPKFRIQTVSLWINPFHRMFGKESLQVVTAGGDLLSEAQISRQWVAPLAKPDKMEWILEKVRPGIRLKGLDWKRVDPRAKTRMIRIGLVLSLICSLTLCFTLNPWWLISFAPLAVLCCIRAYMRWKFLGYALTENGVIFKDGWWNRRRTGAPYSKIQALRLSQSPFDRRYKMASLTVDTAGRIGEGHRITIPYLSLSEAAKLLKRIKTETTELEFKW